MTFGAKGPAVLLAVLSLSLAITACGSDSEKSGNDGGDAAASLPGDGRYFSAASPWNTKADRLPESPRSDRMLALAGTRRAIVEVPGEAGLATVERTVDKGFQINTERWAPLIVKTGGPEAVEMDMVCRQRSCGSELGGVPPQLDLPAGTRPDPRYDGWLSVIDPETNTGYDFWRARRQSSDTISYQFAKPWALGGPGFSRPVSVDAARAVGARGSGLPLFAGVIGPQELRAGVIDHALAVSVPGLARRNYVQPASVTDGTGQTDSLPAGARIRLRGSVRPTDMSTDGIRRPALEAILVALRRYGAIVVDRASVPTLYAAKGTPSTLVSEDELKWLKLDDFEVVALPPLLKDPPLDQVEQVGVPAGDRPAGGGG